MSDAPMKTIVVLGSTGSIGTNTLDVVRRNHHLYKVYALVAGHNIETLTAQILEFRPKLAVVATADGLRRLTECLAASGLARTEWPELGWGGSGPRRGEGASPGVRGGVRAGAHRVAGPGVGRGSAPASRTGGRGRHGDLCHRGGCRTGSYL